MHNRKEAHMYYSISFKFKNKNSALAISSDFMLPVGSSQNEINKMTDTVIREKLISFFSGIFPDSVVNAIVNEPIEELIVIPGAIYFVPLED